MVSSGVGAWGDMGVWCHGINAMEGPAVEWSAVGHGPWVSAPWGHVPWWDLPWDMVPSVMMEHVDGKVVTMGHDAVGHGAIVVL